VLSYQSIKTNKAADATIEACVVMFFACDEWHEAALSLTGPQSNERLSDNYGCSALFVLWTACWPIMSYRVNVAVNWVCVWRAVHT